MTIMNLRNWKTYIGNEKYSGTCGTSVYWQLRNTGVLIIYGSGPMANYTNDTMPWYDYLTEINTAVIMPNVTSIGEYVFYNCQSLKSISLPNTITSIEKWAFNGCKALKSITLPDTLVSIGFYAIGECEALTSIAIPASVTSIGGGAFYGCHSLTRITFNGNQPTMDSGAFKLGTTPTITASATIYSSGWADATVFTSDIIGDYTTLLYVTI